MDPAIEELVDELEANRAMFTALCLSCGPDDVSRVGADDRWAIRDHVAHVASYDQLAIGHLAASASTAMTNPDRSPGEPVDSDAWNAAEIERREGRDITSMLDEMGRLRTRSLELLAANVGGEIDREIYFPGDARRASGMVPLRLWLRYWSKHDMLHAQAIVRAVPQLTANADFQSWLADDPLLDALNRETGPRSERGDSGVAN
jgi:hypothetical protein